ncbi:tRNA (adenosine(37)-N6)-dimethylallyltransferase MiaA [Isachenkonia alkalipeptolytica]|uniref:tRNA dimethylallyltransferase n=1 Tax=Isachenkonia alkalipeptolytica TaxID=2565777 RepID=A0AA43XLA7_9CLOT|nr:tRNA (adenosine(37)-N6)-dimethylallyltransferase MiaA [Isachenkonia alkalipeptolytica]NBG88747.1 tRNA (adenosine(37)-N6)-dimethylallyltransferase MiaA [Isachenkonia alkalipeptolytica]
MKKHVIFIVGPTAVGKTSLTIELAKALDGEVIYADSMQIYKEMNIGTAKPSKQEQEGIPHYMIDEIFPDEDFSVADFEVRAKQHIQEILSRGKTPIVSGGTGLYVNALLYDMDFGKSVSNPSFRNTLKEESELYGKDYIYQKLQKVDPKAAEKIHPNNLVKVIRALEINYETGENLGDFKEDLQLTSEFQPILIGLNRKRKNLYERINLRVDIMIEEGLVKEVKRLLEKGYSKELKAFKGLGYKEIIRYLNGENTLHDAIRILKKNTRRYAKRQITWFKRYDFIKWFLVDRYEKEEVLLNEVLGYIEKKNKEGIYD